MPDHIIRPLFLTAPITSTLTTLPPGFGMRAHSDLTSMVFIIISHLMIFSKKSIIHILISFG